MSEHLNHRGYHFTVIVGLLVLVVALAASIGVVYVWLSAQITAQQQEITQLQGLLGINGTHVETSSTDLGLRLSLSINSTTISTNQTIEVGVYLSNILAHWDNVTAASSWGYPFPLPLCGIYFGSVLDFAPYNFAVFPGFYSLDNFSQATRVQYYYEEPVNETFHSCLSSSGPLASIDFYPADGKAVVNSGIPVSFTVNETGETVTMGSGYSASAWQLPITFLPGKYTVLAGDEWGQLEVLHFIVTS